MSENEEFVIEAIKGFQIVKGTRQYFIKWQNYDDDENTWEDEDNLICTELIKDYNKEHKDEIEAVMSAEKEKKKPKSKKEKEEKGEWKENEDLIIKEKKEEKEEEISFEQEFSQDKGKITDIFMNKNRIYYEFETKNGKKKDVSAKTLRLSHPEMIISFLESRIE